tara:strand:- start:37 stop:192 length:156 start_codon:yes stop_codon:yes gene_type:complete
MHVLSKHKRNKEKEICTTFALHNHESDNDNTSTIYTLYLYRTIVDENESIE